VLPRPPRASNLRGHEPTVPYRPVGFKRFQQRVIRPASW
jgi:hypothetical protein